MAVPAVVEEGALQQLPHSLLPFLQAQSQGTLTRLWGRPSACLSVFRLLRPLDQQLVMNLLWLESAVPAQTMQQWIVPGGNNRKLYHASLEILSRLHILSGNTQVRLQLNSTWKASLRAAITGGTVATSSGSFGIPAERGAKDSMDKDGLDAFALERWETILHFMVSSGTAHNPPRPSAGVLFLLQRSGLMGGGGNPQITSAGFQFLLHEPHAQLWELLLQYLRMAEERQMDLVEVLSFIFMLSTTELGREYSTENLSDTQKAMLEDLRDYGLIWQQKPTSKRFSPTRLATTLTSSSPPLPTSGSGVSEGFIVLETNYRLYAYTDNPLQTAVLALFTTLRSRFPNLVVGQITRESVKRALQSGISAEQIISYLSTHAHPQMRKNNPLIPVTVQDQIRLWELEKNRLKSQEGFLYTEFASQGDYEYVLNYARELNVVLWENPVKRCFFGSMEGHANIRGFIERRKAQAG
ncbi:transcription factor Tfb2 [Punctularia strigosozonata HHB-11173 SS5]|uniref:RNA polymerase II transcription factor B subunit 2 n=1 Tax=Punctularia strigosozonata (strain HHB-11173) TaxID=741275 RepID=R7S262_PUNST|nr:transcription factor Tfb2 [Punctularia strigosozonata HHB-11173 SS5]EIN03954.1 transcription factor Tfb2 [Punctularia strigosozonata HHB-11173 SS5]